MRCTTTRCLVLFVVLALAVAACSGGSEPSAERADAPTEDGGWLDGPPPALATGDEDATLRAADSAAAFEDADRAGAAAPAPSAADEGPTLNAGSVDDNDMWDEYLLYRQQFDASGVPASRIEVEGRQILEVVDEDGAPIVGATLEVRDASGEVAASLRSYADGRALFHPPTAVDPNSQSRPRYEVVASKGDESATVELDPEQSTHRVVLDGAVNGAPALDVLFLIDATGSMSDEIERLKANIASVAEQVGDLPGSPSVRFAMTVYRDRGDAYVTRTFDFTDDLEAFGAALDDVVADGGGDTPEALGAALAESLHAPSWRTDDAVKLVFLVADAPPHLAGDPGYEDEPDYASSVREAARLGVKILPIASSGLDSQGQYVFRQLAQITMGRLVFLTYGADGSSPGTSTPLDIAPEDYDVLSLDALVVQLVRDEMAPLVD
jgi:hypothetical protein